MNTDTPDPGDMAAVQADETVEAQEAVWDLVRGLWRFSAVHALLETGVLDAIAATDYHLTFRDIARRCNVDVDALWRVLAACTSIGAVTFDGGYWHLGPLGRVLLSEPGSMRWAIAMQARSAWWESLAALPDTLRTGTPALAGRDGTTYEVLERNRDDRRIFDRFMATRAAQVADPIAADPVFDRGEVDVVVDVGGGDGTLLAAILHAHPGLRGVLLETETVASTARAALNRHGLGGRVNTVAGDFTEQLPGGGDVYVLASVLHNLPDHVAVDLLRRIAAALPAHGAVLLVEATYPTACILTSKAEEYALDLDVRMLSHSAGGHERPIEGWRDLAGSAGLTITTSRILPSPLRLAVLTLRADPEPANPDDGAVLDASFDPYPGQPLPGTT